jgi:hypothetical protein
MSPDPLTVRVVPLMMAPSQPSPMRMEHPRAAGRQRTGVGPILVTDGFVPLSRFPPGESTS